MINASRPPTVSPATTNQAALIPSVDPSPLILSPLGYKRYFVTHGGLFSRDDVTLDEIRRIPRLGMEPGPEGLMAEMLWTDPQNEPGRTSNDRVCLISYLFIFFCAFCMRPYWLFASGWGTYVWAWCVMQVVYIEQSYWDFQEPPTSRGFVVIAFFQN